MSELDKKIMEHYRNSKKLREIYAGNDKISFGKGKELQKQQDDEYRKMMFLKKLRKEMNKNGRN